MGLYTGKSDEQRSNEQRSNDTEEVKEEGLKEKEAGKEEIAPSTIGGRVLMPIRDMLGYSFFVSWAFLVGWGRSLALAETDQTFMEMRAFLFGGIALGSIVLFVSRGDALRQAKNKPWEAVCPLLCMLGGLTFLGISGPVECVMWLAAGLGQAAVFFFWGVRLRILSSKQQLYVICCGFVVGGASLAFEPFILPEVVVGAAVVFPLASYVLLRMARVRFEGYSSRMTIWNSGMHPFNGVREFKTVIPFKTDRRMVVLKAIFSCIYSLFLGFVTCMTLIKPLTPSNEVIIGLGNIASALIMLILLVGYNKSKEGLIPRLYLPVTCVCMCLLGATWPTEWILLCTFFLFSLFGCLEILNAYSAYIGTPYDAVRWFWEIHAAKMGNSVGFFLGWVFVLLLSPLFTCSSSVFLLTCFGLVCVAVVLDSLLFRHPIFEPFIDEADDDLEETSLRGQQEGDSIGTTVDEYYLQVSQDMAQEFKLSPRQTEIFIYLARGRNVQFIREKLVLSTPTVKSHVYSIYQKMGIHSHQELIDMVEARLKDS